MADYTVTLDADFSQVLAGFAKVGQTAKQTGDQMGKGLSDGLTTANANIDALKAQIRSLVATRSTLKVDSAEFKAAQQQIDLLQGKLAQARGERLRLQVDASAVGAAADSLSKIGAAGKQAGSEAGKGISEGLGQGAGKGAQDVLSELNSLKSGIIRAFKDLKAQGVDPTSDAYKALQARLAEVNQQIRAAKVVPPGLPEATDGFRLLDGVVQGVAFSLSNAVVNSAQQAVAAIGNLVNGYARLDTVIRQAAAASGGPGDYEKLASTIDRVGIDAAGTSEQVAALSLELARGGMSADRQAQSLSGIVRGAEATATSYDRMGQIVSATLTSFGLDASETTRVVDALVQGANASATDVSGLGEAFKLSAPAAKLLGVNVEGLATAVGLFTNAGITASEAGTALRNGLSQLAQAAPKNGQQLQGLTGQAKMAADTVKRLGLDIYTASGQLKPMEEVLLAIKKAMAGMTAGEQSFNADKLFGGADDAAKWLAVISQSEEKIKAMASSMNDAKGATDRNYDAMQNFEQIVNKLTGTLDTLGKNVGKVAATALLPLVQAANNVVGAVSNLPGPVKDTAIALGLLTGGIVGATTAWVIFQRVIQIGALQTAAAEVAQLAVGVGTKLKAGIDLAVAAWPAFIAQLRAASVAQFTFIGSVKAAAAAIKAQLVAALEGAKAAVVGFIAYLRSASFAQFIAGARAAIVALAPMAAAAAALTGAFLIWRQTLAGSDEVQQKFAGTQQETKAALDALKKSLGETGASIDEAKKRAENARNGFVAFWNSLRAPMAMREATIQTLQLQAGWESAFEAANRYAASIKNGPQLSGGSATEAVAYAKAMQAATDIAQKRAQALREMADANEANGQYEEAAKNRQLADVLDRDASSYQKVTAAIQSKLTPAERELLLTDQQRQAIEARVQAEQELNRIISEAPARQLGERIAVSQQLLGITKATGEAEQARFSIAKAGLELELKQAQARGAGEGQLEAIRLRIAAADREALTARFRALVREQDLQRSLLALEQQKARLQAQSAVDEQRLAIDKAKRVAVQAQALNGSGSDQSQEAEAKLSAAQETLAIREREQALLNQTQPLERKAADLQAQTARAGLQARAAQDGYRIAANGSLVAINAVAQRQQRVAELTEVSRRVEREVSQQRLSNAEALSAALQVIGGLEQSRFGVVRSGLEFELQKAQERGASEQELGALKSRIAQQDRAAMDARYQQLQREQELELAILAIKQRQQALEAQRAVAVSALDLRAAQAEQSRARATGDAAAIAAADALAAKQQLLLQGEREKLALTLQGQSIERAAVLLRQGAADNAIRAEQAAKGYAVAQEDSGAASQGILAVNQAIAAVLQGNAGLAGQQAQDAQAARLYVGQAADGSIVIANSLGDASAAANSIKSLDLAGEFSAVASSMGQAATQAQAFYSSLKQAAALPGARWSGGPVEAGQEYRINELGQEAFLSAGRLSLIDAPANSIWRAPSPGVVIPAGVTARLQAQGRAPVAVSATGGGAGVAELAIEVGKLRQEVGNLARRDWSVQVQQRTGPTGAQVLRRLL